MIHRLVRPIALLALLGMPLAPRGTAAQNGPDPFRVLEQAGRTYRAATGLCAQFRQTLMVPLLGEERSGHGRLCTRPPDLFSMRFAEPSGDVVLADGTWLWVYQPSADTKQVLRAALDAGPRGVDFYREFLDAPREKYRAAYGGRETVAGKATHRISLTPIGRAPYRTADVWIDVDGGLLRRVEIREENGSVRTVTLDRIEVSPRMSDDTFRFVPPPGSQVVTR